MKVCALVLKSTFVFQRFCSQNTNKRSFADMTHICSFADMTHIWGVDPSWPPVPNGSYGLCGCKT